MESNFLPGIVSVLIAILFIRYWDRGVHHIERALGFIAAWTLYLLGDLACDVLELADCFEFWVRIWYPVYNNLMIGSSAAQEAVNGEGDLWPWEHIEHDFDDDL